MGKGIVFSLDAVLTLLVLLMLVPLSSFFRLETTPSPVFQSAVYFQAQDAIDSLSRVRIAEVRANPAVASLFDQGLLTGEQLNSTVLDAIGGLWAANTTVSRSAAVNLTRAMLDGLMPASVDWALAAEVPGGEDLLYNTSAMPADARVVFKSTRYASGFQINQPPQGYVARAVLDAIRGKQTAAYAFLGGFVGQGNITATVEGVPSDADVKSVFAEGAFIANASFHVNGVFCGFVNASKDPIFQAANATFTSPACLAAVARGGRNVIAFNFSGVTNIEQYAGGGYVRITYSTQQFNPPVENRTLYRFPGIRGLINLYDSFYVPGNATNVSVFLHVNSSYSFYLTVGNATIVNNSGDGNFDQKVGVGNATFAVNLSKAFYGGGSTLNPLNARNVPVRLGLANIPLNVTAEIGFVFDVSGSMAFCTEDAGSEFTAPRNFSIGTTRYCGSRWKAPCNYPDLPRIETARNASNLFVDTVISGSRNRMGIVEFTAPATYRSYGAAGFDLVPAGLWPWWSPNHPYRRQLNVGNYNRTRILPAGTQVPAEINHSDLVTSGKSLANASDLRVAWFNRSSGAYLSLERYNTTNFNNARTRIWFNLQRNVSAGANDTDYFLYYGNFSAGPAPDDPRRVFLLYDDFADNNYKNATNWTVKVNSTVWAAVAGNLTVNSSNCKAAIFAGDTGWRDYVVEAEVLLDPTTGQQNASLLYYFNSTYTGGYESTMMGGSLDDARIYRWSGLNGTGASCGGRTQLDTSDIGNVQNNRWYKLKAGAYENYLYTFVDGTLGNKVYNTVHASGLVGLAAGGTGGAGGSSNVRGRFRNVLVRRWVYPEPSVQLEAEERLAGGSTTVKIGVLNNGTGDVVNASNNTLTFADGTLVGYATLVPLAIGKFGGARVPWNFTVGTFTFNASADRPPVPDGEYAETNESNNISAQFQFRPDLKLHWARVLPVAPPSSQSVTFVLQALVENQGHAAADGVVVRFLKAAGENSGNWNETTLSLPPGASALVNLTAPKKFTVAGQHNLTATADADGAVAESDEDNNAGVASIYVGGVGLTEGDGPPSPPAAGGAGGFAGAPSSSPPSCTGGSSVQVFSSSIVRTKNLTNDARQLTDFVAGADTWSGTCICCGMNEGISMLLSASVPGRSRTIVLMTDGAPNVACPGMINGTGNPTRDALQSACNAYTLYGIRVFTVGFGNPADGNVNFTLLQQMGQCGGGANFSGKNAAELSQAFNNIAQEILNQTVVQQVINVSGDYVTTELFPDSSIEVNYTQNAVQTGFKEITVSIETNRFGSCGGSFFTPSQLTPSSARVTSYSGSLWTANLSVNSSTKPWTNAYRLGYFGQKYDSLGDPFAVHYPPSLLARNETNYADLRLGINASTQSTECSNSSRVIYDARVKASVGYGSVFVNATGFNLTVYHDLNHDGYADGFTYVAVGQNLPFFNSTAINVSGLDTATNALADAVLRLLGELNYFDPFLSPERPGMQNNSIDIQLSDSIAIQANDLGGVPFMWGPNAFSIRVWGK